MDLSQRRSDEILDDIIGDLRRKFGITIDNAEPNSFGYANLKWKIATNAGVLFVKQYNVVRYSDELLQSVEMAIGLQDKLNKAGIPCPRVHAYGGSYIQRTNSGERYMITEYCPGRMVNPGEASANQMYHLGQVTGRLHQWLTRNASQSLPLHWTPDSKETTLQHWAKNWHEAQGSGSAKYISALEVQRRIIDVMDPAIFQACEEGWVHWDLFVDNILFHSDSVSAILDFDRMNYIYPEFDISRAILSGAIANNRINMESAQAFIDGYRESIPLPLSKLVRSIRLTWWKEAAWLSVKSEEHRTLRRFAEELMWVGNHWTMLEEMFD